MVFGDIGTSPLYAFRECLGDSGPATAATVLGLLSLIVWTLLLVVALKYAWLILRFDNDGEGGILALAALARKSRSRIMGNPKAVPTVLLLGMIGTALLIADGMITPAISVLGALEGLHIAAPAVAHTSVPIALIILFALFSLQKHGTARVGSFFGPVILLWFLTLGILGLRGIWANPGVIAALNPIHAIEFLFTHGAASLAVLGSVFLVATGAEALYADLGHFGAVAIRRAWWGIALPGLLLNYLGQGALVLSDASAADNPFYRLAPPDTRIALLILATLATIVASQALITGAFSLARQAVMLGLTPRLDIRHTSESQIGQVYVPFVNWFLLAGTAAMVVGFGTSTAIASAYGLAVAFTMLITTTLLFIYLRRAKLWSLRKSILVLTPLLLIDAVFVSANLTKVLTGGWLPLGAGAAGALILVTWYRGQTFLSRRIDDVDMSEEEFLTSLDRHPPTRVRGTAVVVTRLSSGVPRMLLHLLKHTKSLHERVILLTVDVAQSPRVSDAERLQVRSFRSDFIRINAAYGFMESPDIPALLKEAVASGAIEKLRDATYFVGRVTLLPAAKKRLNWFPRGLFCFLFHNAHEVTRSFAIPPNRTIEIGVPVEI